MFEGEVEPPPPTGGVTDPESNRAPTISGQPPTTIKVNQTYDFQPYASDPDGDTLRFEIQGRPSWATFNPNSGRLYGTPPVAATGTVADIEIRVTDGLATTALAPFSIAVSEDSGDGVAELSWTAPTQNTDGTPLQDLAGFNVYYGRLPNALSTKLSIANPNARGTLIGQLTGGTWYFAVSTFTASGIESARTNPVWKSI